VETKSSHVLVGGVVLMLFVALFAFVLWLSRADGGARRQEFDIFFPSASGIARGSAVNFQGVPVGQVQSINLNRDDPSKVRVRITVQNDVPILEGTSATLEGVGFTGVSVVNLEGAMAGRDPLDAPGPFGVPVIPVKPGTFELLGALAPELLRDASKLVNNLNAFLDAGNRAKVETLLDNLNRATTAYGESAPELRAALKDTQDALREANVAARKLGALADSGQTLVDEDARALVADLRATTAKADAALAQIERTAANADPALRQLSETTLPQANALMRDLRTAAESLTAITERVEVSGAASLLGARPLPDYQPEAAR
jgi:phospholipid/cholesterol/gamma-HCH transport system substrate-binding protein